MVNTISECSYQNVQVRTDPSLRSSHKTFVTPSDHRGYLRLAKDLIRLLRSADVQSQSVQADPSLFLYRFYCRFSHAQTHAQVVCANLKLSTLRTFFSRQHFEIFFSFFQENIICTSCKLSPLHEMSNPVFLVMKRKKKKKKKTSSICRLLN